MFPVLTKENVIFGIFMNDGTHSTSINTFIILGKIFLHKNRFLNAQLNFFIFHKELCLYFSSLKLMMKKKTKIKSIEV